MRPELLKAAKASWERNESTHRYFSGQSKSGESSMIGGTIVGIARGSDNTLVCVEDERAADTPTRTRLSIRVVERRRDGTAVSVALGDTIWWQGDSAFWTPRAAMRGREGPEGCGTEWDIKLAKIGYSH